MNGVGEMSAPGCNRGRGVEGPKWIIITAARDCVTCVTERRAVAVQMQDELWAIGVGAVASLDPSFPGPLSGMDPLGFWVLPHERRHTRDKMFCACGGLASLLRWPA